MNTTTEGTKNMNDDAVIVSTEPAGEYDRVHYDDGTFEDVPPLFPRESEWSAK